MDRPYNTPLWTQQFALETATKADLPSTSPFRDAVLLDTESTGITRRRVTTELSLYDPKAKTYYTWVVDPVYINPEGTISPLTRAQLSQPTPLSDVGGPEISEWFTKRAQKGGIYENVVNFNAKKYNQEARAITNQLDPGSKHIVRQGDFLDFASFLIKKLETEWKGRTLAAHNVNYDFGQVGALLRAYEKGGSTRAPQLINRLMSALETATADETYRGTAFESGLKLQAGKAMQVYTGDQRAIIRGFHTFDSADRTPIRDSLTLARSVMEMYFGKKSSGTASMDIIAAAMGLEHHHRAFTDIKNEHVALNYLSDLALSLDKGRPLTDEQRLFMARLAAVEPTMAQEAFTKILIEGRLYHEAGEVVRPLAREGKEPLRLSLYQKGVVKQVRVGKDTVKAVVPQTVGVQPTHWEAFKREAILYAKRNKMNINTGRLVDFVESQSHENLRKLFHVDQIFSYDIPKMMEQATVGNIPRFIAQKSGSGAQSYLRNIRNPAVIAATGIALAGLTAIVATSRTKADPAKHNDIEGLPEGGVAEGMRAANTEFGSGWQGLMSVILPGSLYLHTPNEIERRIEHYKRTIWQDPGRQELEKQKLEAKEKKAQQQLDQFSLNEATKVENISVFQGINPTTQLPLYAIRLNQDKYQYYFDDADTLVLKRRGWFGFPVGKDYSIRLAGMDAPEVAGHKGDPLQPVRIAQDQPWGKQAAAFLQRKLESEETLTLVFSPNSMTYGRHVGVLYDEQMQNINLQLVKAGMGAYLPFGEAKQSIIDRPQFAAAEQVAMNTHAGMWREPFWGIYRAAVDNSTSRTTFNTFTRLDKLAQNENTANLMVSMWKAQEQGYLTEEDLVEARGLGHALRNSYNRFGRNKKRANWYTPSTNRVAGDPAVYNEIEGMPEGGQAGEKRLWFGFGSPWQMVTPAMVQRARTAQAAARIAEVSSKDGLPSILKMQKALLNMTTGMTKDKAFDITKAAAVQANEWSKDTVGPTVPAEIRNDISMATLVSRPAAVLEDPTIKGLGTLYQSYISESPVSWEGLGSLYDQAMQNLTQDKLSTMHFADTVRDLSAQGAMEQGKTTRLAPQTYEIVNKKVRDHNIQLEQQQIVNSIRRINRELQQAELQTQASRQMLDPEQWIGHRRG